MAGSEKRYFFTLDALRGIAAIVVLVHHAGLLTLGRDPVPFSFLAVDVFFLLSGIVIAVNYDAALEAKMTPLQFMTRRLIRLYPLYLLGLVIAVAAGLWDGGAGFAHAASPLAWGGTILASLMFLPSFIMSPGHDAFPLNYPAWSLFFELLINLVYAVAFRHVTVRRLLAFAALNLVLYILASRMAGTPDIGWSHVYVVAGAFRVGYAFSLGVVIARTMPLARPKVSSPAMFAIAAALIVLLSLPIYDPAREIYGVAALAVVAPLLVLTACFYEPKSALLQRLCRLMGRISYPIYMIHAPILYLLTTDESLAAGHGVVFIIALAIGLAGVSLILEWGYDLPLRRTLGGLLQQPVAPAADTSIANQNAPDDFGRKQRYGR